MGSICDYEYSVTQSMPGDYCYVKWWDGGPIPRAELRGEDKSGKLEWRLKALPSCLQISPYFWFPKISSLPRFDGLTVFCQRETKNTGYVWLIPCCVLFTRPHGCLSNRCWAGYSDNKIRLCGLGGL